MTTSSDLPKLPRRSIDSHKGNFGRGLLIGGCRGMTGAIAIAAQSALRSGAGLISVAAPDRCIDLIASFIPAT